MQELPPGFVIDGQPAQGGNTIITKRANPAEQRGTDLRNQMTEVQIAKMLEDMRSGEKPEIVKADDGSVVQIFPDGTTRTVVPGNPSGSPTGDKSGVTAKIRSDALQAFNDANALRRAAKELRDRYASGPGATSGLSSLYDYLPTEANQGFDEASQRARGYVKRSLGFTGGEGNTVAESSSLYDPYLPSTWDKDGNILGKITALEGLATDAERKAIATLGGVPDQFGNITQPQEVAPQSQQQNDQAVAGAVPQQDRSNQAAVLFGGPGQDGGGGGFAPYGATMKTEANPQWKGVNQAVKGMIVAGRSPDEIKAFLNSKGIAGDAARGVDDAINYFRKTGRDNFGVDVEKIQVSMSGFEQFRNNAPQTKVGTALATAGNAGGFGVPQMLAGSEGLDYLRSQEPEAAFAGDVAGVIGGTAALGRAGGAVAGRVAPSLLGGGAKAAAGRQLATDATYGGIYGGATEGTPEGALMGAGTAALGSGLGMIAGQGIKSAIAPSGGRLAGVMADGARPTLGQRMVNSGGPIGQTINGVEEVFKSYPVLGAAIDASREAGRKSWQGAGFQRALSAIDDRLPTGITEGPEAFKYTRKAFDDTYDKARSGMQFVPDQGYQQEFGQWQQNWLGGGLLDSEGINQVQKAISTRVGSRMRNGVLTGDSYKKAVSDLNSTINNIGKPEVKKALAEYRTVLDGAARRNSDPAAVELMDKADFGYSQFKPLKDAARRAGSEPGYFTPQGLAAVERQQMGKTNAFIEGDTRLGDYIKQGDNFRDRVPNSGTPERLLTIQTIASPVVGTGAFFSPATLAAAGLTLPYMPIVEKGAKALIAPRGGKAKKVGGMFGSRKAQKALGAAGAGAGVGTLPYIVE